MKNCPYCNQYIDDDCAFCLHCNKPLIIDLQRKQIPTSNFYNDQNFLDSNQSLEGELYDSKIILNEEIEQKINEINNTLEQKEKFGESIGDLLLEKASLYYKKRDFSTSLNILESALNYFKEENNLFNVAISHNEIGLTHEEMGFFDDAIYHFERSIEFLEKSNEYIMLIQVYNNLGNIFFLLKDLEHSYEYYDKALKLAEHETLISEEIKTSSNFVDVLFSLCNYEKIDRILKRNLEYFRQIGDLYGTIISISKIGKLNYYLGPEHYNKSYQNFRETLDLIKQIGDLGSKFMKAQLKWECFHYLGKLSLYWKNYDDAEDSLLKSLDAISIFEIGENLKKALVSESLAHLYELKGEYERAINYYSLCIKIHYKFGEDSKCAELKKKIAQIYLDLVKNESEAIKYYEEALDIFADLNYTNELADISHKIGDLYANKGNNDLVLSNWINALNYYRELQDNYNINLLTEKINSLTK